MLAERDDVLVGRLGVVLLRGAQVGQVELELARLALLEGLDHRMVAARRAAVRLGGQGSRRASS